MASSSQLCSGALDTERERLSGAEKVVCVTGASVGYIASWVVKLLLHHGYTVKASVRNLNDPKKTDHLLALDGAKKDPLILWLLDVKAELIGPAVKRTLNVFASCAKNPSVKRVVLTSSMSAVLFNGKHRTPDVVVDETWFSDAGILKESKIWYSLSKTLSEEAAWKFAKEKGLDMVTINPTMVIGPLLQPTLNASSDLILSVINGAETFPNSTFGWVNVKDAAEAHIKAFEHPSASGRYCLVERLAHYFEVVKSLHEIFPTLKLPENFTLCQHWYALSKTLGEEAAWKFAKEKGLDMVTINPAVVIGPLLQPTLNSSSELILSVVNGAETFPNSYFGWVNVKDVAEAHIKAFELPSVSGRYCLVERPAHYSEVVMILCEIFPTLKLPDKCADDEPFMPTYLVSNEKAKRLGIEFIPLEASLKETVESLMEKKFVSV